MQRGERRPSSVQTTSVHSPSPQTTEELKYCIRDSRSYPPQNESRVIHDLAECCYQYPSLRPIVDNFTSSEGSMQRLVALRGTVPIFYKGATYKIPVHIWVMPYHPAGPPLMFVVPTRSMVFRQRHPHVDCTNGLVYLPYLSTWDALSSTIFGSIQAMIQAFALKPPVYSRGTSSNAAKEEQERRRLIKVLSGRMTFALNDNSNKAVDTVAMLVMRKEKVREESTRDSDVRTKAKEKAEVEAALKKVQSAKDVLNQWVKDHPKPRADAGIDDVTHARDMLQEQSIQCLAEDAAFCDALDQLDEAISKGVIEDETYMRDVRRVAREQFLARALLRKIRHRQAEEQSAKRVVNSSIPTNPRRHVGK